MWVLWTRGRRLCVFRLPDVAALTAQGHILRSLFLGHLCAGAINRGGCLPLSTTSDVPLSLEAAVLYAPIKKTAAFVMLVLGFRLCSGDGKPKQGAVSVLIAIIVGVLAGALHSVAAKGATGAWHFHPGADHLRASLGGFLTHAINNGLSRAIGYVLDPFSLM